MSNNEHNQNNQQKQIKSKSSVGSTLLIIFLIVVIMVTSSIGLYAWAKYTSSISGNATAQVAKWSFKLVDGVTETSDVIEFAFTRTDGYEHVAEGRLAPGTFGKFEIGIDAKGTETLLEYIIDVELENKPTYLKFYRDEAKTKEITVTNNKFSVKGFMSLEDVKEIRTETIYWDWPYENGDDVTDTEDAGKLVTMQVSVTGYEVLEELNSKKSLVSQITAENYGQKVNYSVTANGEIVPNTWSVLHNDGEYVYIIYDDYLPVQYINTTKMNQNGMQITTSSPYSIQGNPNADYHFNEDFVEKLTNSSNWSDFVRDDLESKNVVAIGSPTIQVWKDSWNATGNSEIYISTNILSRNDGNNKNTSDYEGYYIGNINNPTSTLINGLDNTKKLYFPKTAPEQSIFGYWLASSSAEDGYSVMVVLYHGGIEHTTSGGPGFACRPVVKLPSTVLGEYKDGEWNIE